MTTDFNNQSHYHNSVADTKDEKSKVIIDSSEAGEKEEKLFTQAQLEALISERIKRERKVNEALLPVKELLLAASRKGLVKGKSYVEMAQDLASSLKEMSRMEDGKNVHEKSAQKDEVPVSADICTDDNSNVFIAEKAQEDVDETQMGAVSDLKISDVLQSAKDGAVSESAVLKDSVSENMMSQDMLSKDETPKENVPQQMMTIKDFCRLKEKYPDVDMNSLFDNGMFESFSKGKTASIVDLYDDFCAFLSSFAPVTSTAKTDTPQVSEREEKRDFGDEKIAYSTAISSQSGVDLPYSDGLTKQQMDIAKSAGMSYREYAYLLSSIPKGKTRN